MTQNTDTDELESKIEHLEEIVANQQDELAAIREETSGTTVSRRALLASGAGLAGLGALSGSATAAGEGSIGTESDPLAAIYADAIGSDSTRVQDIYAETFDVNSLGVGTLDAEYPRFGTRWTGHGDTDAEGKDIHVSQEPIEIFVSPNGDDTAAGTQSNPIASPREASRRVPKHNRHEVRIYFEDGEYLSGGFRFADIYVARAAGKIQIYGHHPENPLYDSLDETAVTLTGGHLDAIRGGYGIEVFGIQTDGMWQYYDSIVRFEDCDFTGGSLDPSRCLTGYTSKVFLQNCHFHDGQRSIQATRGSDIVVRDCTAANMSSRPFHITTGSNLYLTGSDSWVTSHDSSPSIDNASWAFSDGDTYPSMATNNGKVTFPDGIDVSGTLSRFHEDVAHVDSNVELRSDIRRVVRWRDSNGNQLAEIGYNPVENWFIFRDDGGNRVARIDRDTGDMVLAGSLTENGSP